MTDLNELREKWEAANKRVGGRERRTFDVPIYCLKALEAADELIAAYETRVRELERAHAEASELATRADELWAIMERAREGRAAAEAARDAATARVEELEARGECPKGSIKRELERAVGGAWRIVDGCIEAMLGGGLIGYISRMRDAHHALIISASRPEAEHQFESRIYAGCSCGDVGCDAPLWIAYAQRLIDSYESKVMDFAAETLRTDAATAAIKRMRELHPHVTGPTWEWKTVDGVYQRVKVGEAEFCTACSWAEPTGRFGHDEPWPCPTIAALDAPADSEGEL